MRHFEFPSETPVEIKRDRFEHPDPAVHAAWICLGKPVTPRLDNARHQRCGPARQFTANLDMEMLLPSTCPLSTAGKWKPPGLAAGSETGLGDSAVTWPVTGSVTWPVTWP